MVTIPFQIWMKIVVQSVVITAVVVSAHLLVILATWGISRLAAYARSGR